MKNNKLELLVLTDHSTHGRGESIYPLLRTMKEDPVCHSISVASRSNPINESFFEARSTYFNATSVDSSFEYSESGYFFIEAQQKKCDLSDFDAIFLRIDRPRKGKIEPFLDFLCENFDD